MLQDPCGVGPIWDRIFGHYVKELQLGINIQNKDDMRYDTILGYIKAAFELFRLRDLPYPFDLDNKSSLAATILNNIKDEETIATQRAPLTSEMFAEMLKVSSTSDFLSLEKAITDLSILGRYLGPRLAEYGQKTKKRPEYHTYPSGTKVLKAWSLNDFVFYDENGKRVNPKNLDDINTIAKMSATFKVQKNRRNNEVKEVLSDPTNTEMCPVRAAFRIAHRSTILNQPADLPVCVYRNTKSELTYLTGSTVSSYFRQIAKMAHPSMNESERKRFSAHSLRVTAAVLLHEHGCDGDYIKIQLRWLGDSYRVYLRSTQTILKRHTTALSKSASLSIALANIEENISHTTEQISEEAMGEYHDIQ